MLQETRSDKWCLVIDKVMMSGTSPNHVLMRYVVIIVDTMLSSLRPVYTIWYTIR